MDKLFGRVAVHEPDETVRVRSPRRVDLRSAQSAVKGIRKAFPEPILSLIYTKAPVARALVEVIFSLGDCAFDPYRFESLCNNQTDRACPNNQNMEIDPCEFLPSSYKVFKAHNDEDRESVKQSCCWVEEVTQASRLERSEPSLGRHFSKPEGSEALIENMRL